ncbi:MlaD family protein [Gordonia sp. VNQ95]|jgi:hypothetical protein|uniref:MlaD family protein n=1 Tax=Gordonia sp. VNQ95 TaxID=3156619 RepID=UPI0032B40363
MIAATTRGHRRTTLLSLMAMLLAASLLTGCSAYANFSPEKLPTPQSLRDGREVTAEVPTAVNLPLSAKVVVNGIDSGSVQRIEPGGGKTLVRMRIDNDVVVSGTARLELKQDTLLGDTYVSITNPSNPTADALPAGGTLGLAQVAQPVQVEQLMSSLANFLGSGSLPQLGNTFATLNKQFPADPQQVRDIEGVLTDTLDTWAQNTSALDTILTNVAAVTEQLKTMTGTLEFTLSQAGVDQFRAVSDTTYMVVILARLSEALGPAMPLVPVLSGVTRLIETVVKPILIPGWPDNQISNAELLADVINDKLLPYFKNAPGLNIRSLTIANDVSDRDLSQQMVRVFRMLGMVQ